MPPVIRAALFDLGGVILSSPFEAFAIYERDHDLPDGFLRRVNTINPGLIRTPDWVKTAKQIAGEDGYEKHLQGVADEAGGMKRFGTPEELANFFVFLCSNKASYSTGSTYFVDGGWLRTV